MAIKATIAFVAFNDYGNSGSEMHPTLQATKGREGKPMIALGSAQFAQIGAAVQLAPGAFLLIALAICAAPFAALYALELIVDKAQGKTTTAVIVILTYAMICLAAIASI